MSLLMDALRKAEEAKRRAAQESDEQTMSAPEAPVLVSAEIISEPPAVNLPEPEAIEPDVTEFDFNESQTPAPVADVNLTFDDLPDAPESANRAKPSLDIPLDFYLDVEPVTKPEVRQPEVPAATKVNLTNGVMPELKLMDVPAEAHHTPLPTLLLDTADSTQANELIHEVSEQIHKAAPVHEPEPVLVTQETVEPAIAEPANAAPVKSAELPPTAEAPLTATKDQKETPPSKVGKDKLAARRSARAVFAAKSGPGAPGNKRLIILGSTAACLLLVAAGGWYFLTSVMSSGNQYNFPVAYDNSAFPAPEVDAQLAQDAQVADQILTGTSDGTLPAETLQAATIDSDPDLQAAAVVEPALDVELLADAPTDIASAVIVEDTTATSDVATDAPVFVDEAGATEIAATQAAVASEVVPAQQPEEPVLLEATSSATVQSTSPVQISRSQPMRNPDMQMLTAWSAYQQGDFAAARILYQQSLAQNPDNRDALLGVAASAMQQGDMASARQTYSRLLSMNPRDPLARTGMLETTTAGDPVQRESDLKALQSDHPEQAAISYALGNLYAGQQRWHEAHQAYYNALLSARTQASGPVSPDYAFNLAISLERINQPQAALNFYREAKTLSNDHTSGFDMAILEQRLQALERIQP